MKRKALFIIFVILCIIIFMLFKNNRKLNEKIDSYENYVSDFSMDAVTRGWVIPILSEEELDVNELYQVKGMLDTSHTFVTNTFGNSSDRGNYLWKTFKNIEKLIELIESNGTKESINKVVEETMMLQEEILDKYGYVD